VHVRVASVQVQPVPLRAVGTILCGLPMTGRLSTTVTVPTVGPNPTLLTVMMYCAPVWPRWNVPVWVLVMARSGALTSIVAVAWLPEPALVELTIPVVFTLCPAVWPTTLTEKVQKPPAAIVPPERLTTEKPDTVPVVIVPAPHDPVRPFGVATARPAGSVSPKPTPVSATVVLGLVIVKVRVVVAFKLMLAAPKALAMLGGAITVMDALEVLPGPLSVAVTWTLLLSTPAIVPVTFTLNVQEAAPARVAPERLTADEPAAAVMVPPPHEPVRPFGVETTSPAGRLSVNAMPVKEDEAFGLLMVKLSEVLPFRRMVAAPKDLVMVGGVATLRFAVAVLPVPPLVELTLPVVLVKFPEAVPVTFTVRMQLLPVAMVPPVSEILPEPATAVAVPPQVLVRPFGVATTSPAGKVSVNATPFSATVLPAGLVMVKVRDVVPFSGIAAAPKALAIDGGATTLMLAEAVPPVPPSVEVTLPVVLFCVPAAIPVTFTENVHDVLAARVAPERLMTLVA